ncbi:3-phosphoshikimate 1-carboxyvinyltransferase [uncultured Tenacibaculum sp.]|uniref:3-phosphoshikimate 1-carboxyvinyltransferase n=1 Tax=uncultured Tenacibaculum sp. TaxID=174713 RepID=UPI002629B760|nr:3-phosphoshikimate 1-carboxyvinyltransferase [uncultured Tenacibaculum sp.]
MNLQLTTQSKSLNESIIISGSKSESNRLLILQKLYDNLKIENLSDSDDSNHLLEALTSQKETVNIGHAGTAMRFLTAYFACLEGREVILTGSERMQNRPIGILVDALRSLGAKIEYVAKEGYPPLKITGQKFEKNKVQIDGNVSSQYISALALIASSLENGLEIELIGKVTSVPYVNMTLSLLNELGISTTFKDNIITVFYKEELASKEVVVESDWSSASYFYSLVALSELGSEITLTAYKQNSLQGDSCLSEIYKHFGVTTNFKEHSIVLKKEKETNKDVLNIDLKNAPDIAQTIAVTCFGLEVGCDLEGLHTLKIKETDRLEALKEELTKFGAEIEVTNETLHLKPSKEIAKNVTVKTYQDHRMAMAFAPLALKVPVQISEAMVVTKSYRSFWNDMKKIGMLVEEIK